jgi:arylformamidase
VKHVVRPAKEDIVVKRTPLLVASVAAWLFIAAGLVAAQPALGALDLESAGRNPGPVVIPPGVRRMVDVPYGPEPRQRMDVYLPAQAERAPILLMVHGGAWMIGNKAMPPVVNEKIAHWVRDRGWILVSTNYRLVPEVDPLTQAQDVARAIAATQAAAPSWGGDPARLVLMGHSAGAHLVALLSADPALAAQQGARPWLGTVVLDSAALDTAGLMQRPHMRFYDRVFGSDPAGWRADSPTARLSATVRPMLLVCSTQRTDGSCEQSNAFARRVQAAGGMAKVLPRNLTHAQVDAELGLQGAYTQAIDAFIASIDRSGPDAPR